MSFSRKFEYSLVELPIISIINTREAGVCTGLFSQYCQGIFYHIDSWEISPLAPKLSLPVILFVSTSDCALFTFHAWFCPCFCIFLLIENSFLNCRIIAYTSLKMWECERIWAMSKKSHQFRSRWNFLKFWTDGQIKRLSVLSREKTPEQIQKITEKFSKLPPRKIILHQWKFLNRCHECCLDQQSLAERENIFSVH